MSKQVQVTFHQGVHSCDLRFTRDYVRKSLLICLLILDLSSSSSDLQLMCEGLRDKSLSSVKVLKDVYTFCDLSKQFTDPSLKGWNFCDWYKLDTKVAMTLYWTSMRQKIEMAIKVTVIMKGKMEKSSCSEDIICGQSPFQACDGVFVCAKTCEGQHML